MKLLKSIAITALAAASLALSSLAAEEIRWDFNRFGDNEGWVKTNCTGDVKDGSFDLTAITNGAGNYDPFISHDVDFNAEDYPYIVVCMKWENERNLSTTCQLYFSTEEAGLSESTRVPNPSIDGKTTEGKYLVRVFDMTVNEKWKGKVTRIRIDALDSAGDFSVDYIYCTDTLPEKFDAITTGSVAGGKAAEEKGFKETRTYEDSLFDDVPKTEWYHDSIAKSYALGFVNGKGENKYDPDGTMTVAEALTIAARMNSIYEKKDTDFTPGSGDEWFTPYVSYCVENGICGENDYDNLDREIKRSEMAVIFAKVLPEKTYKTKNTIGYVPDIAIDAPYRESVLSLYNAGILLGNDEAGTFCPDNAITRAEVAAIVNRVALPDMRVSGKLLVPAITPAVPKEEGYYLIDNPSLLYGTTIQGAFRYNIAGGKANYTATVTNVVDDTRVNAGSYITRAINTEKDGVLTLNANFKFSADSNGAYFNMTSEAGKKLFEVFTDHGKFLTKSAGKDVALGIRADINVDYRLDVIVDLDAKTYTLFINGAFCGTMPFAEDAADAAAFTYGSTEAGTPMINLTSLFLYKNYYLLDNFDRDTAYTQFTYTGDAEHTANGELTVKASKDKTFTASAPIAPLSGKFAFETMLFADKFDGISFAFTFGDKGALTVSIKDGKLFSKTVATDMWNLLRIEGDTVTATATVKLNGKVIGSVDVTDIDGFIDGVTITAAPKDSATVKFDELYLTKIIDRTDYVPKPEKVESDCILGINMCSLWREGYHMGWDCISPYDEIKPVLGFYDEGNPEVADWEIKFLAEHGIDYELLCWYGNAQNGPVKLGRGSASALHEGYFNAKYTDDMKFAIMWENASNTPSLENFKKYVVPYWVEYYLTDERYMVVDNKPVLSVWSVGGLISKWGVDGAKEAVQFVRDTCKELGFDDALMLCCDVHSTRADQFKTLASIGLDATYAYHWNAGGSKSYNQIGRMQNYLDYNGDPSVPAEEKIPLIPTVSVGFNSIGWAGKRTGLINDEEYGKVADFIKSDMLPANKGTSMENMVIISTWNEYGEGTYMMPSEALGFEYLDNVRRNFTAKPDKHDDAVPTAAQKARIGRLYPQSQTDLSPMYNEDISEYPQTVVETIKITEDNKDQFEFYAAGSWEFNEFGNYKASNPSGNPIIFNKQPYDINIDNCSYIRITMRGGSDADIDTLNGYFFYATDDYPGIEEAARTSFKFQNGGDMETIYVNMAANARWHGTLKTLRVDPCGYGWFEIDKIEILEDDAKIPVRINGNLIKTYGVPNTDNGMLLVPAVPAYGLFTSLAAGYDWDAESKALTVSGNGHTVVFSVGKAEATVDGKAEKLGTTVTLFDNVPLIPLDFLSEALGYEYVRTETEINIRTPFN